MRDLAPGVPLSDRYVIERWIADGGMSTVWRAQDLLLGRAVAVKVLSATADPLTRDLIWREARAAARLSHPNVAQIYDYGEYATADAAPTGYLVMELVAGTTLAERLDAGPIPIEQGLTVIGQVAAALAAAHQIGLVHRDVKPGNVMLTVSGAKVLDFGIAVGAGHRDLDWVVGTPRYLAPERRAEPGRPAEPAVDVYALGLLMDDVLGAQGRPDRITSLQQACVDPVPERRPSAEQVASALSASTSSFAPTTSARTQVIPVGEATRLIGPADQTPPRARRRGVLGVLTVAAVTMLVGGIWWFNRDDDANNPSAQETVAAPSPSASSTPTRTPVPTPEPEPSPQTTRADLVAQIDRTISEARAAGGLTGEAQGELRGALNELRRAGSSDVGWASQDLRGAVRDLRADGEINRATADRLLVLLDEVEAAPA